MPLINVTCEDAISGRMIGNASFELYYRKDLSRRHPKKKLDRFDKELSNTESNFALEVDEPGIYFIEETKAPVYAVQVEDENCDLYTKTVEFGLVE